MRQQACKMRYIHFEELHSIEIIVYEKYGTHSVIYWLWIQVDNANAKELQPTLLRI